MSGPRVQAFTRDGISGDEAPESDLLDLGDLLIDRWYFVSGKVLGGPGQRVAPRRFLLGS